MFSSITVSEMPLKKTSNTCFYEFNFSRPLNEKKKNKFTPKNKFFIHVLLYFHKMTKHNR